MTAYLRVEDRSKQYDGPLQFFLSFSLLYIDLFKLTGTDLQIQDLCLMIAGLSEILVRVLSDVYEIHLRFISADGCIIF